MRVILCAVILIFISVTLYAQNGVTPTISTSQSLFTTDTARYLEVGRIFIIGNKQTRDHIILRELSLKTGDVVFSLDLPGVIEKDRNKLFNTRLFNTVEIRPLELVSGKVDLLVNLTERWYTFPAPKFELSDRNFNEWWQNYNHDFDRVNYGLTLYRYNMRGRNETLKATLQFGFSRIFHINYRIPYIDKKQKHGVYFAYDFRETKNLPYQTNDHKLVFLKDSKLLGSSSTIDIGYTFRRSFYDVHSFGFQYAEAHVSDTITQLNDNYFKDSFTNQQFATIYYQYTSDHRDYFSYPLHGSYLIGRISKTGLGFDHDLNKTEVSFGYSHYFDLGHNYYFSNYTFGLTSFPDTQPYSNYSALGYRKQVLRGYEIYVIEGPVYGINKSTFKKRIFSHNFHSNIIPFDQFQHIPLAIYLKTYLDFGYVKNYPDYEISSRLADKLLVGGGFGLDFVSYYDVVIRLEYSFNREGQYGFFLNVLKEF